MQEQIERSQSWTGVGMVGRRADDPRAAALGAIVVLVQVGDAHHHGVPGVASLRGRRIGLLVGDDVGAMRSEARQTLIHFLAKIASLEILFGGPLVVSDDLRPLIGAAAAVTVAVVPVALFYVGADALADAETGHLRRTALRLGVLGVWLVAPMNAYAIARLLQGDARFGAITLFGVVTCSLVILAYLFLVRRAFRSARLAFDTRALEDFGGPIE